MLVEVEIPFNKKKVQLNVFKFKHINELHWLKNSLSSKIKFLEGFIQTPRLSAVEKFISLMLLRSECIDSSISVQRNNKSVNVDIEYILESFSQLADIKTTIKHDSFEFVFDYPSRFCVDSNTMLSVLRQIKLDDSIIDLDLLSDEEFNNVISNLPPSCLSVITSFIDRHADHLTFSLLGTKDKIDLTNFNSSLFVSNLFDCVSEQNYREYLFLLSKRFSDINFVLNCTFYEIEDYLDLYRKEAQQQNIELQKTID
tara:strand:- start:1005 stop:1772 length:768 start_codon:yes stop_codon:yes gene_type:complete